MARNRGCGRGKGGSDEIARQQGGKVAVQNGLERHVRSWESRLVAKTVASGPQLAATARPESGRGSKSGSWCTAGAGVQGARASM